MEIITRKEAVKLGLKRYFTGKPCKHGHVSEKYVHQFRCVECRSYTNSKRDKKEMAEYTSKYRKDNAGKVNANTMKRKATKLNATVSWSDKEAIERMYIVARFLTETTGEPYHVDHKIPLQGKNICGLHVETNLDVIPGKENLSKSNKF